MNVTGVLAAYAADRYRLGERSGARKTLLRALKRGDLAPQGRSYISRVDRFLRKIGYLQKKK